MTSLFLVLLEVFLAVLLILVTFVQLLYLESLRLRARELPALELFKETIEERIGLKTDLGTLSFSLIKHSALWLSGILYLCLSQGGAKPLWEALLGAIFLSFLTMIVTTYIIPQLLYRRTTGQWLLPMVPALRALSFGAVPVAWMVTFLHSLFELGGADKAAEEPTHPSEHIEALISAGTEEGIIDETDRRLIQSVVAFGDKTVREVMTPRPNIVAIQQDRTLEDLRQLVIHEQYSRIPVYEGSIDHIAGFVHVRDMFEVDLAERQTRHVRELARPIRLVPETKRVDRLMREMQQDGAHMAIVVDEYGNTAGVATMEDLVEEILGEIHDEHEPERDVREESDGSFIMSGSFDVSRLQELMDFRPQEETESTTIGGLMTEWLGHVPSPGETIAMDGIQLEAVASNELRVEQVRATRKIAEKENGKA